MKKIISYSLWGDNPVYTVGAQRNSEMAFDFFPGWICRYYISTKNTDESVIEKLRSYSNTEVVLIDEEGSPKSMLWRFKAIDDEDVSHMLSRDTDCRFCAREVEAVNEWVHSDKSFHIMRDHPYHQTLMMGGMWGIKSGSLRIPMTNLIEKYLENPETKNAKGMDQTFLSQYVWSDANSSNLTHDPFFVGNDFPTKRTKNEMVYFIGECVTESDGLWSQEDRDVLDRVELQS